MDITFEKDDHEKVAKWLRTVGVNEGWMQYHAKKKDVEIWQLISNNRAYRQITVCKNKDDIEYNRYLAEAIMAIADTKYQGDQDTRKLEAYRELFLEGVTLTDLIPVSNENEKGVILEWRSRENTGSYYVVKEIDSEGCIEWRWDTDSTDRYDKDIKYVKELFRQFANMIN